MTGQPKKKLLIISNPTAGRRSGGKLNQVVNILKKNHLSLEIKETKYPGHAKLIARENATEDFDMIIAAGGDGTINEVLNGLYPHQIPFGLIPLGTVNVLAKEINLKTNAKNIADCLLRGRTRPCWLGQVNGQYFSLMVSAGPDALSVAHVNLKMKKIIGQSAYILSFFWQLFKRNNITYRVTTNGKTYDTSHVIVTKGRLYGGNYICAPEARLDKDQLYIVLARKSGRLNTLKSAYLMFRQKYPYSNSALILPTQKVMIECKDGPMPVQIDGDHGANIPVKISLSECSINLVQPENRLIND